MQDTWKNFFNSHHPLEEVTVKLSPDLTSLCSSKVNLIYFFLFSSPQV